MKKNQHVVPYVKSDGKKAWAVKSAGSSKVADVFDRQLDARKTALTRAKSSGSELFVHGRDGRIRERNTYGRDKFPPRG